MVAGIWGRKIGMTQIFFNDKVIPVTVIDVADWLVTGIRTEERDGYEAVRIGYIRKRHKKSDFSSEWLKHPKKYFMVERELKLVGTENKNFIIGSTVRPYVELTEGEKVDVFGKTKGSGFSGVVKRHGFGGPPGSHGSTMGKRPGSIGFMRACGKVIKGKKMPGHMGNCQRVMKNLEIVKIENEANAVLVKGSIPGKAGKLIFIRKA